MADTVSTNINKIKKYRRKVNGIAPEAAPGHKKGLPPCAPWEAQKNPLALRLGGFGLGAWQCPTFAWGSTLSSARGGFTSEVGMGSGGSRPPWPPGNSSGPPLAGRALRAGGPSGPPALRLSGGARAPCGARRKPLFALHLRLGARRRGALRPAAGRLGVVWPSLTGN